MKDAREGHSQSVMLIPRISIITPSFNQAPFIERTIESVLGQKGHFALDYRILDGASTDGTLDIMRRYEGRLRWSSAPDKGQVDAINRGLREAEGDIVGWLNSDDILLPGALARVVAAFEEMPAVEWVHGRCEIIDIDDRPIRRWVSRYKHARARHHTYVNLLTENYVSQMTAFWRRSVHGEIGYLDPTLQWAFDYDLWLRLGRRGDPAYIDEPVAAFRWYESSKSGANFRKQFREDAEVATRYMPAGRPWIRLRKRAKNWVIVNAYRLMVAHGGARSLPAA